MGMYTHLQLDVRLRKDTPVAAIEILHIMCQVQGHKQEDINPILAIHPGLAHPLFNTWRGAWMLRCNGGCGVWAAPYFVRDEAGVYQLKLSFSVKNYERSIQYFLDWLSQFVSCSPDEVRLGTYMYEEDREESSVVWKGGKLKIVKLIQAGEPWPD